MSDYSIPDVIAMLLAIALIIAWLYLIANAKQIFQPHPAENDE